MPGFITTAIVTFLAYLLLVAGSWTSQELAAGAVLSVLVAALSFRLYYRDPGPKANPLRWILSLVYLAVPFLIEMAKAYIEVAWRVLTGRIRPGIIRYDPGMKTDFGTMMIANSITLTPGTLSVDVDEKTNEIFVHVLNIAPGAEKKETWKGKDAFALFDLSAWVRRIAE